VWIQQPVVKVRIPPIDHGNKRELAMNEKEIIESSIAICKCCLLAQAMKNCSLCRFNTGLVEQVLPADAIPLSIFIQESKFAMSM